MSESRPHVGVIGLGAMGGRIAAHLIAAGCPTAGFDINSATSERLRAHGVAIAANAAALAAEVDLLIISLPSVDALSEVVTQIAGTGHAGLVVIETSTFSPAQKLIAREGLLIRGIEMLDAPISGTSGQLVHRDVAVYVSGAPTVAQTVDQVLATFARERYYLGEFGNGSRLKLISNLLVTIHTLAAAEALTLAESVGIDAELAWRALTDGSGTSRMLEVRGPMMVQRTYTPPNARLMDYLKDIALIDELVGPIGIETGLFDYAAKMYRAADSFGLGEQDHAVVADLLRLGRSGLGSPTGT